MMQMGSFRENQMSRNAACHNMKNLSGYLKSAKVTIWEINSIGGERKVRTEKERNKQGEGVEWRGRSEGLDGWGLLTITTSSP